MKASPSARSWIAAGVRHELLTRALPTLRHDMVAPVSVIRMGLLMLKRKLGAPAIDPAACTERIDFIDNQIGELIAGIRSLRHWELAIADDGITRSALVAECVGLMRAAFDMQGTALEVEAGLEPVDGEAHWPEGAALRYLLLGAMGHLHDSVEDLGVIVIAADGAHGLLLSARPHADGQAHGAAASFPHRAPRALAIDAVAIESLADDLGYAVVREADTLRLDFNKAGAPTKR